MAETAVRVLLSQLSAWLQEEQKLLGELKHEAQLIHDELEQMTAFLGDVYARKNSDPQLQVWVRQVREIAYDTEDALEAYILQFSHHHHITGIGGHLKKLYDSFKNLKAKHRMASEIKSLRSRSQNASKMYRDMYAMFPGSSSATIASDMYYDGRGDALLLEEADVVGIDKPKNHLLNWVLSSNYTLRVVSVVGMPGIGKTTLVKKVFDHPQVKERIDHHVWITVSQMYKVENILRDIIKQLQQQVEQASHLGLETMNEDGMRELIYYFLEKKRYIIVLDDIWSANAWEALKYGFPRSNDTTCGCIIITSRFINIGDMACCESGDHMYHLKPLSSQHAEELFHKKAFLGGLCPQHLKEITKSILKRCGGLPLAIVLIGGVLATKKNDIEEWTKLNLGLASKVEGDSLKRMESLLSLSYYDLPSYLKTCFLFLSIFPEDHVLEKSTIIRLWVAEGFVRAKHGKTMEEIAEGYFNELCNRSLIQSVTSASRPLQRYIYLEEERPRNFSIHDLVRGYIVSKAGEENIVGGIDQSKSTWVSKVRRLALDGSSTRYVEQINDFKYLRSLLFFGSIDMKWKLFLCNILRDECRMLKELDLRGTSLDTIPEEVFKLYHLKYLCLRDTQISVIPKAIGNLRKLETLDLKRTNVREMPTETVKLHKLKYFSVFGSEIHNNPRGLSHIRGCKVEWEIGQLSGLQKLDIIDASANVEIVHEVGKLIELKKLGIVNLSTKDGKELCHSLAKLNNLRSLYLASTHKGEEVIDLQYSFSPTPLLLLQHLMIDGLLRRVPRWMCALNALTRLHLRWIRAKEDPLEYLQGLFNLQFLELRRAYDGQQLSFKSGGFQRLIGLCLVSLQELRRMEVEKGSMPCLKALALFKCERMTELPQGIEHLSNLQYVLFENMSKEFVQKQLLDEITREKHRWKLNHVPLVDIVEFIDGKNMAKRFISG